MIRVVCRGRALWGVFARLDVHGVVWPCVHVRGPSGMTQDVAVLPDYAKVEPRKSNGALPW